VAERAGGRHGPRGDQLVRVTVGAQRC
jgi:hypothetical protein